MIKLLAQALAFVEANPDLGVFSVDICNHTCGRGVRIQVPADKLRAFGRPFTSKPVPGMPKFVTLESVIEGSMLLVASEEVGK